MKNMHWQVRALIVSTLIFAASFMAAHAATLVANNSPGWKYFKGTQEASSPTDAWRAISFNDASWLTGTAPFWYDDGTGYSGNTDLGGQNVPGGMRGNYRCIYLRRTFQIASPTEVSSLTVNLISDDACIVWINGTRVADTAEVPAEPLTYLSEATGATGEPKNESDTVNNPTFLVAGTNVIAIQAFNDSLSGSSDFLFDLSMTSVEPDPIPPTILGFNPAAGTVSSLTQIEVLFSEPVAGLGPDDLLLNGIPATGVTGAGANFTFTFPQPNYGTVQVTWSANHGIEDTAFPPNAFNAAGPGATWQYELVDTTVPTVVLVIPAAGSTVRNLNNLQITFSEAVGGIEAEDLLINGVAATNLNFLGPEQFQFVFAEPSPGPVQIMWRTEHGIHDLSASSNRFAGGTYQYLLDPNASFSDVRINEFLASNDTGIRDEDGDREDWIEIFNGGSSAIDLAGWYLTDDVLNLDKWRFPSVAIPANGYLVVWASGKNKQVSGAPLHTNFRLNMNEPGSANPDYLGLVLPDGTNVVSSFGLAYPQQYPDVSFGRDQLLPDTTGYFTTPTPDDPNSTAGFGFGPEVTFSRSSGTFLNAFNLELSVADPNYEIRYFVVTTAAQAATVNVPNTTSTLYGTTPISVTGTVQVRARAFPKVAGYFPGPARTETFFQINAAAAEFTSDLPLIIIHNFAGGGPPADYTSSGAIGFMMVFGTNTFNGRSSLTNAPEVATRMAFHVRGSSTAGYPKRSFAVETWTEVNYDDRDVGLLGLPSESDWVLYAPNQFDRVMLHNPVPHALSRQMGHYSSRTRFAEVFVNLTGGQVTYTAPNAGNYNGIYVIEEKIKVNNDRVDIGQVNSDDLTEPRITGGYILKVDRGGDPDDVNGFGSPTGYNLQSSIYFVDPDGRQVRLPQQRDYVINYIRSFETALRSGNFADPVTGYAAWMDVDQWIDNHILNTVPFNVDGYRLSGFFHKPREGKLRQGPLWDFDRSQGTASPDERPYSPRQWRRQTTGDQGTDLFGNPSLLGVEWWQRLFNDINFWQKWIDRWQEVRKSTWSTTNIHALIDTMADQVREAHDRDRTKWTGGASDISPRNGTLTFDGYSFTFNGTYQREVEFLKQWYTDRLHFVDTNFLHEPVFSSGSGQVPAGYQVTLTDQTGKAGTTIYYTLNGTDPRLPGGGISPSALSGTSPLTITVNTNVRLFARNRNPNHRNLTGGNPGGNPPLSSPWSGPTVASFYLDVPSVRISEIMYHPADPAGGNTNDTSNFEYLEVQNIGAAPVNLAGFRLRGGIEFDFPNLLLPAGEFAVVVKDLAAFASRYDAGSIRVAGTFTNNLGNDGDHLILEGSLWEPIHDFDFRDGWYPVTDGPGFSLQIVDATAPLLTNLAGVNVSTWSLPTSWRPSGVVNGTPGTADPGRPSLPPIYVNEVLTHTDPPVVDAIELYNPNGTGVDLLGWFLTDDYGNPAKYRIAQTTVIPANGYVVFYESNSFGVGPRGFAFSSKGDAVYLFSGDANTNLTGYYHGFDFGVQFNGVTFGRHVISTGNDHFVAQTAGTLGEANAGPLVGPVVISEIMYHPPDYLVGNQAVNNTVDEYLELHNTAASPVALYHQVHTTNTWRLDDAVTYQFPRGTILPAGGYLLVVSFDPADAVELAAFRARHNVPPEVPVFGPWSGALDNNSEAVELLRPDLPDVFPSPSAGLVPYVLVERINYKDEAPWPGAADGIGPSLHRVNAQTYGNDPANWAAAGPGPGQAYAGGDPPVITEHPASQSVVELTPATFSISVNGSGPFTYLWRRDGTVIHGATGPTFTIPFAQLSDQGVYSAVVLGGAGAVVSSNATLTVLPVPQITTHPESQAVNPGVNATFSVVATGTGPLMYQWRRNGEDLPGATTSSYTVINPQLNVNDGAFTVVVTDSVGSRESLPAILTVKVRPTITQQMQITPGTNVLEGSTFTITITATGSLPMGFRFRAPPDPYFAVLVLTNTNTAVLTVENASTNLTGLWDCGITNLAGSALSAKLAITVQPSPPFFVLQPTNQAATVGTTVTLAAEARGSAPISYQWYFNATNALPDGTNASLVLSNVAGINAGEYLVVAANGLGLATSAVAQITLGESPVITQQPTDQSATVCADAQFAVTATGAEPFSYQWYLNATEPVAGATGSTLLLPHPVPAQAGDYTVVVSNPSGSVTSQVATLTLLLGDSDNDGISDEFELTYGLNPCDENDRNLDGDLDGRTNWEEFVSGTDPTSAASVLQVTLLDNGGGGARLQFQARANVGYTILHRTSLTSGEWTKLTDVPAQGAEHAVDLMDPNAGAEGTRFYRVVTPIQP